MDDFPVPPPPPWPSACAYGITPSLFLPLQNYGVCLVPGSSCASPGYVRVSFANMKGELFAKAADRLKRGLSHLVDKGMRG